MLHVDDGTLHAYLDGELSPADAQGVAAHLAQCPNCRARRDEEQALIARADELLGLAAPPDRAMPPFRVGDLEAPRPLWWRLRLPLAWAATLIVALGIGTYVGGGRAARQASPRLSRSEPTAGPGTTATAVAPPPAAAPAQGQGTGTREKVLSARATARRAAPAAAAAAPAPALASDALARAVASEAVVEGKIAPASDIASPTNASLSLDSARVVLGEDPVALPGVPIRSIRLEQGTEGTVVVVRQALDSTTVIELRERRRSELRLPPVLATTQARQPQAAAAADSVGARAAEASPVAGAAPTPPPPRGAVARGYVRLDSDRVVAALAARRDRPMRYRGQLVIEIAGPLSTDSLRKVLLQARPIER
jgi:hypothetical protein